jgi:hypothetical protein
MNESLVLTVGEQHQRGGVPLASFLTVAGSFREVARAVNEVINLEHEEPAQAEMVIVAVSTGSIVMDLRVEEASAAAFDVAREVTNATINGLALLESEATRPPFFSDDALRQAERLVRPLSDSIAEIRFKRPGVEFVLTSRVGEHVREILASPGRMITSVEGRIYRINVTRRQFGIYDARRKQSITCTYPEELFEEVRALLRQFVLVRGKAATDAAGVIQRMEVRAIRPLSAPESRRSLDELFGADPDFTGGVDSVAYVREHRGKEATGQ